MDSNLDRLAALAKSDPSTVSPAGRARLEGAGYGHLFDASALDTKAVSYPPLDDPAWGGHWLQHPSGYLVSGPGSTDVINAARGGAPLSSVLYAALAAKARHYIEPALCLWTGPVGDVEASERVESHPVLDVFANPSPWWTLNDLKAWICKVIDVDGDAYLLKLRDGGGTVQNNTTGRVVAYWPMSPAVLRPARDMDAVKRGEMVPLIQWYEYEIDGRKIRVPVENVIHFRDGIDPTDPARGVGAVRSIVREIASDGAADLFVSTVLNNLGVVGLVFAPKGESRAGMDVEAIKSYIMATSTGGKRGQPIVFKQPTDFYQMKADTEFLDLSHVWRHVESRITSVLGIPAILVGLEVGLDSATYSNARTLLEFFTESTLMSVWARDGERWTLGLRDDFGLKPDQWIGFNVASVRALAPDRDALWTRVVNAWDKNAIDLATLYRLLDLDDAEIPAGLEPLRKVEIEALASAPAPTSDVPAIDVQPRPPSALPAPADELDDVIPGAKAADGLATAARVTEGDVDDAVRDWDDFARKNAPQFVGMLGTVDAGNP